MNRGPDDACHTQHHNTIQDPSRPRGFRYNLTGHVGCPTHMNVITLPFYLFGASEHTQWGAFASGHGTTTVA